MHRFTLVKKNWEKRQNVPKYCENYSGMLMPCSGTCFLKLSVVVLLKVATKGVIKLVLKYYQKILINTIVVLLVLS